MTKPAKHFAMPLWRRISFQLFSACIFVLSLGFVRKAFQILVGPKLSIDPSLSRQFIAVFRDSLSPEPIERGMYLITLLLLPPLLLFFVYRQSYPESLRRLWANDWLDAAISSATAFLLVIPILPPLYFALRTAPLSLLPALPARSISNFLLSHGWVICLALVLLAVIVFGLQQLIAHRRRMSRRIARIIILISTFLLIALGLNSFRLFGFIHLDDSPIWWVHLEVIASSLSQVIAGRTLLVDIPSQYGLFPELLAPILHFLPAGVVGLSIAFAVLQVASLSAVMYVLQKHIHSLLVLTFASFALVTVTFGMRQILNSDPFPIMPDPYFQYWPVRFAAPAFSIPVALWAFRRFCWPRLLVLSLFIGVSLFWNLDSGVAILYAVAMLLFLLALASFFSREDGKLSGKFPLLAIATVLVPTGGLTFFGLGLALLALKAGQPLDFVWLVGYQKIFYQMGFYMLAMQSRPHLWHIIAMVYIFGVLIGLYQLRLSHSLRSTLLLLYVSLLGSGLFAYYQGRSHVLVLEAVSWPAFIVVALLVDRHFMAIGKRLVSPVSVTLPLVGIFGLLMPSLLLAREIPSLIVRASRIPFERKHSYFRSAPYLVSELSMVHQYCSGNEGQCLMLMKRQGIYSLETKTASSLKGPSPIEIILQSDYDSLRQQIRDGVPSRILLGIKPESRIPWFELSAGDLSRYQLMKTNPEGTVQLLVRRPVPLPN